MIEEGKPAPEFELQTDEGETVRLSDFKGKPVVLYFYPKDDTPGCTTQACGIRDAWAEFQAKGAVVLGVSPDDVESHRRFREKHGLQFSLLSDPERQLIGAYDVWKEKSYMGRTYMGVERATAIIGADGAIKRWWPKVKPDEHADQVLAEL